VLLGSQWRELVVLWSHHDPNKHVISKGKGEKESSNVKSEFPMLISWDLVPVSISV